MCGIAGAIDMTAERALARVSLLNDAQTHRGPDHSVIARAGGMTLGNTRLAIQDPTPAGNQPFVSADGRYTCVFNGEIYNHQQLVERFRLPVRTTCDGEVIPQLWAKLGVEALAELRGMFAIALADTLEDRLYLARDPFGIKPLYWRLLPDGSFAFASEVRPLAQLAPGTRMNDAAVARYLRYGAMAADQSPFREITAVPPNSVAVVGKDCRVEVRPIRPDGPATITQRPSDLGAALAESVRLHLGADVPTALLLSGGVDSAAVAAIGRHLGQDLHCLTVVADGAPEETVAAAQTARHYGHRFQRVQVVMEDSDAARFFQAMQRPSVDGLNTYLICRAIHQAGFKVAMSGLGGDEVVGGYSHFRRLKYLPLLRAVDAVPLPVGVAAARLAGALGVAGEAKARRLLGKDGPRSGAGLARPPARAISRVAGERPDRGGEHSNGRGRRHGGLASWVLTGLVRGHGCRRGLDLLASHAASRRRYLLHGVVGRVARSLRRRPRLLRRARKRPRPEQRARQGGNREGAWRSLSRRPRDAAQTWFQPSHGAVAIRPASAAGHSRQRT